MTAIPADILKAATTTVSKISSLMEDAPTLGAAATEVISEALMGLAAQWQELYDDKVDGLEADLESAVEVAFKRGAREWTRLNYRYLYERWTAAEIPLIRSGEQP